MSWPIAVPTQTVLNSYPSTEPPTIIPIVTSTPNFIYSDGSEGFLTSSATSTISFTTAILASAGGFSSKPACVQGPTIALGIICGLLIIGITILLYALFILAISVRKHNKGKKPKIWATLDITPVKAVGTGHCRQRRTRTDRCGGGSDDYLDYDPDSENATGRDERGGGKEIRTDWRSDDQRRHSHLFMSGMGGGRPGMSNYFPQAGFKGQNGGQPIPQVYMPGQQFRNGSLMNTRVMEDEEMEPLASEAETSAGQPQRNPGRSGGNDSKASSMGSRERFR